MIYAVLWYAFVVQLLLCLADHLLVRLDDNLHGLHFPFHFVHYVQHFIIVCD